MKLRRIKRGQIFNYSQLKPGLVELDEVPPAETNLTENARQEPWAKDRVIVLHTTESTIDMGDDIDGG